MSALWALVILSCVGSDMRLAAQATSIREGNLPNSIKGAMLVSLVDKGMPVEKLRQVFGDYPRTSSFRLGPGAGFITYIDYGVTVYTDYARRVTRTELNQLEAGQE